MSHCAATPLDDGDTVAGASSATLAFDEQDGSDCVARGTSVALFLGAGSVALAVDELAGGNGVVAKPSSVDLRLVAGSKAVARDGAARLPRRRWQTSAFRALCFGHFCFANRSG